MAESVRDIKRRIKSVESTEHITNAMRLVSAARYRRARVCQEKADAGLKEITGILQKLLAEEEQLAKENLQGGGPVMLVLITSSRGLCGGYNTGLTKAAAEVLQGGRLCTIGSRGRDFFRRQGYEILRDFPEGPESFGMDHAGVLAASLLEEYREGRAGKILLVGAEYINTLKQEVSVRQILPVPLAAAERAERAERPDSEPAEPDKQRAEKELEWEPSRQQTLERLLPKYLQLTLYQACREAAVCEHAARRTAMESATDNAREMLSALSLQMNRARQQAITDELIEIVSGAESMR